VSLKDRDNPLFFKRDGGMDLSQFILLCIVGWITLVFTLAGLQVLTYSNAAWAFLGSFTSLAFIAWAARDRAQLIANSKTPGEVASGIAKAAPPFAGMDQNEADADEA
jgi:energy-coupling factor transporter transmembrane protein EcfT